MASRRDHISNKQVSGTVRYSHRESDTAFASTSMPEVTDYSLEEIRAMPVEQRLSIKSKLPHINIKFFTCPFEMEKQIQVSYDLSLSKHGNHLMAWFITNLPLFTGSFHGIEQFIVLRSLLYIWGTTCER